MARIMFTSNTWQYHQKQDKIICNICTTTEICFIFITLSHTKEQSGPEDMTEIV